MNLKTRIAAGVAATAMVSIFGLSGTAASAAPSAHAFTVSAARAAVDLPVIGTLPDGGAFTGQLTQLVPSVVNGIPMLSGMITGTGLPVAGAVFTTAVSAQSTCRVLTLNLSALTVPVLGLVNLAPIKLVADAVNGLGNLLGNVVGNLLCALGGLLGPTVVALPLVGPLLSQVIPSLGLGPVIGLG